MQNRVVERKGDVRCVKGDELSDQVRVRVGLQIEDLGEYFEWCVGYVLRIEDSCACLRWGVAAGEGIELLCILRVRLFSREERGGVGGGEEGQAP